MIREQREKEREKGKEEGRERSEGGGVVGKDNKKGKMKVLTVSDLQIEEMKEDAASSEIGFVELKLPMDVWIVYYGVLWEGFRFWYMVWRETEEAIMTFQTAFMDTENRARKKHQMM